jgi:UDP-N-acetyl-D-glucosamine dehydrogenase
MNLEKKIATRRALVSVIGLGYVGLPLAMVFASDGYMVLGFDVDDEKVDGINAGNSYIRHISSKNIKSLVNKKRFSATPDFSRLSEADVIIICVPTPLDDHREPDLSFVVNTGKVIASNLRKGQLIVLESTTYPGTTEEVLLPILESSGLKAGSDFHLAYSPEREDPGNKRFRTSQIPKVVAGTDVTSGKLAVLLYSRVFDKVVPVSSARTAEAVKLTENIFRAVNIALVNELKMIYSRLGINIWEVIEAAKTKPFGYMPFYPGPGLGGHCIPIDPFYLTWKAREFDFPTRFIELAGEINTNMPSYVIEVLRKALSEKKEVVKRSEILILGVAYKKDVADVRETPAFPIIEKLEYMGATVDYYDPFIPVIRRMRGHKRLWGKKSVKWSAKTLKKYDAVIIVTDHSNVNYRFLVENSRLVIDTRNATVSIRKNREKIVLA